MFPLSPDLWEAWLRDEAPGLSPEGLHGLLDAATTDYVSVDLWLFILTLIITGDEEDMEDVEKHRATFPLDVSREWMAKAVASAGSHFSRVGHFSLLTTSPKEMGCFLGKLFLRQTKGYLVWERVFHFELELLKVSIPRRWNLPRVKDAVIVNSDFKQRDPQPDAIKKLRTRFQERLKARQGSQGEYLCLLSMISTESIFLKNTYVGLDKLMVQYSGFESALGGEAYISHMQAASMAVAKCKKENVVREDWETQLVVADLSSCRHSALNLKTVTSGIVWAYAWHLREVHRIRKETKEPGQIGHPVSL